MKIQSVYIKNFRALKDVTIPFDSVTTFTEPLSALQVVQFWICSCKF